MLYSTGQGLEKNTEKALQYYLAAARQGDAAAQFNLGLIYATGQDTPQDDTVALAWYQLAADQGDAQAQFNLGVMIAKGRGIAASQTVAKQWLQLAADQGDAQALYNLGVLHQGDASHQPNYPQALACYRQAAAAHDDAKVALGWLYAKGLGVLQDFVRAHMWFNLGAISGHPEAINGRDFVAQQMIAPQIAAAQDMARACQQANFKGFD